MRPCFCRRQLLLPLGQEGGSLHERCLRSFQLLAHWSLLTLSFGLPIMSVSSPAAFAALSAAFITASDGVATGLSVSYSSLHFYCRRRKAELSIRVQVPIVDLVPVSLARATCLQSQEVARAAPGASPHRASRPFRVFQLVPLVAPHAAHVVLGRAGSAASPSRCRIALVAVWTWRCDKVPRHLKQHALEHNKTQATSWTPNVEQSTWTENCCCSLLSLWLSSSLSSLSS